ncbi:MAG: helix-turn-helix domain-containing protein [Candidatus Cloacimonadales bacterium]|nr:helix-turn-helix domain-containing protein [Candidatus Cloacimonadales bacterium]
MEDLTKAEEKIFSAAKEEFIEKGFDGARMQAIADRAGISKAALHYYYRSKEKLFKKVVNFIFNMVFNSVKQKIEEKLSFEEKVHFIISMYIDTILQHKHMAFFLFSELMKHPQILDELIKKQEKITTLSAAYQAELEKGKIRSIEPRHLILNVVSMCIYPILGSPLIIRILGFSKTEYDAFLQERKEQVFEFVMKSLRP